MVNMILTVKVGHFWKHHPGSGNSQPVVQLEGAGRQLKGISGVGVMRAVWVGVGQGRVLARERSSRVGVHGVAVESLRGDPGGALRVQPHHAVRAAQETWFGDKAARGNPRRGRRLGA